MSSYPLSTSTSSSAWGPGYIPSSIGYTDRIQEQWSREFDPTRLHKNEISGGPMTKSYENLGFLFLIYKLKLVVEPIRLGSVPELLVRVLNSPTSPVDS